jgi:hypothetical protein
VVRCGVNFPASSSGTTPPVGRSRKGRGYRKVPTPIEESPGSKGQAAR